MNATAALRYGLIWLATLTAFVRVDAATAPKDDKVTVEGRVTAVMEIDPPRLDVKVKGERYTIYLTEKTKVSKKGKKMGIGDLREEQKIEIVGTRKNHDKPLHLNANEVKILEDPSN